MATKPQCFAYSQTGIRCEKTAGHSGNHAVHVAWTDDECYQPNPYSKATTNTPAPVAHTNAAASVTEHGYEIKPSEPEAIQSIPCAACSHKHRGGECKCGCYSFIG